MMKFRPYFQVHINSFRRLSGFIMLNKRSYLKQFLERILEELRYANSLLIELINLNERINDYPEAINKAPLFFSISKQCFLNEIIIILSKLLANYRSGLSAGRKSLKDNKDIFKLLIYLEANKIRPVKISQELFCAKIREHREELLDYSDIIDNIFLWRDKCIAHYDNKYFLNPGKISTDAPFSITDLENLVKAMMKIINYYLDLFLGYTDLFSCNNQRDINNILHILSDKK